MRKGHSGLHPDLTVNSVQRSDESHHTINRRVTIKRCTLYKRSVWRKNRQDKVLYYHHKPKPWTQLTVRCPSRHVPDIFRCDFLNKHVKSTFNPTQSWDFQHHINTCGKRKQHSSVEQRTSHCRRGCDLFLSGRNTYVWWETFYDSLSQGNTGVLTLE